MSKWTYEDYCLLPNDGKIHELINGEHYNHAAPFVTHQMISRNLDRVVGDHVDRHKLGIWLSAPVDVLLSAFDVVQPDKIFVAKGRQKVVRPKNLLGAPDLVIEITSEDADYDKKLKFRLYQRRGVTHYWIVSPQEERLSVCRLRGKKYRLAGAYGRGDVFTPEIFPRLKVRVSDIFRLPAM